MLGKRKKGDIHVTLLAICSVNDMVRRLTTIEPRGNLSMLLLTLMTPSRGLTLARSRTSTASDFLAVGTGVIGERG